MRVEWRIMRLWKGPEGRGFSWWQAISTIILVGGASSSGAHSTALQDLGYLKYTRSWNECGLNVVSMTERVHRHTSRWWHIWYTDIVLKIWETLEKKNRLLMHTCSRKPPLFQKESQQEVRDRVRPRASCLFPLPVQHEDISYFSWKPDKHVQRLTCNKAASACCDTKLPIVSSVTRI